MGYKHEEKEKDQSPSSFSYKTQEKTTYIGGKFSKAKELGGKNFTPGPGKYNI